MEHRIAKDSVLQILLLLLKLGAGGGIAPPSAAHDAAQKLLLTPRIDIHTKYSNNHVMIARPHIILYNVRYNLWKHISYCRI